eukprot:TRINITY_DN1750_c0_g4_i2.p2 TRINITY_DN1750_c0_g4~~TRINITY_DN1750_c0_g4_i2.p2  ORF type:complete len:150 (+),score=54.62 TRINITY_DN1750_c0_g4_i2:67-516(+)
MSDDEGGNYRDEVLADDLDDPYGREDLENDQDQISEEEDDEERSQQGEDGRDVDIMEKIMEDRGTKATDPLDRRTPRFLTKYERARIIGVRAAQIARNAPIFVNAEDEKDPLKIAEQELREKRIPFMIRRYLPDGSYEDWAINDLELID